MRSRQPRLAPSFEERVAGLLPGCRGHLEGCNGYLARPFEKVAPWAFTARLFLVVKWGFAIEIAGEKLSWTRETTRVWAADHDDWSAKVAGEGCKRPLEA
jgi:hypothetical protein